jgi:predicted permease
VNPWRRCRPKKWEQDLSEELRFHIGQQTAANIAAGMTPEEARWQATLQMGAIEGVKAVCREERRGFWVEALWGDVRYGLRMLRKSPGFTAVAVLTLALGIGANTAIFSILDPLLLRKLPVPRPDELVWVNSAGSLGLAEIGGSEVQSFYAYRDKAQVFSGVLCFAGVRPYEVRRIGLAISANGEIVSANFFTVLGVHPFAGQFFTFHEDQGYPGNPIVLSFDYWNRAFDADRGVIGETVSLGNVPYTVLGVAPPGFFGVEVGKSPDFYMPLEATLPPEVKWQAEWVTILARLKPGVSLQQAEAGLCPLFDQIARESSLPEVEKNECMARIVLTPASRGFSDARSKFSLPARILMGVVGLVLLIACANVANLLLARGIGRKREITVRLALGAGRWRLVRQLLTESALLAAMGAIAGIVAGRWASGLLVVSLSSKRLPLTLAAGLSSRVLIFAAAVLGLAVLLCGIVPALSATRSDLAHDLKVQTGGPGRSSSRSVLGKLLVVAQVALSVTLLSGAGLLLRSLVNLETFDTGFDRDHVLLVSMGGHAADRSPEQMNAFCDALLDHAKHLPGVRSASLSAFAPVSGREIGVNVTVEGYSLRLGETANELFLPISPGYFETMGISLLAGRDFTMQDVETHDAVVILNRTMAARFFGDQNALGKHVRFVEGNHPPMEIVGVVADSKYNDLRERSLDFFYVPGRRLAVLEVRSTKDPRMLVGPVRDLFRSLDSSVAISSVETLREEVDEFLHPDRLIVGLCGAFSMLALALACLGLYGMLTFSVARRTSEIGIRMALGAHPRNIFRLIVGQGVTLTVLGLVLGAAGALASTSLLASLLFSVNGGDPLTFAAVSLLLAAAAVLACYVPARRAMRVDPMVALRYE